MGKNEMSLALRGGTETYSGKAVILPSRSELSHAYRRTHL